MFLKRISLVMAFCGLIQLSTSLDSAQAGTILTFGQSSQTNTVLGTKTGATNDNGFTVVGTDIPITITQIIPGSGLTAPVSAYLTINLASVGNAQTGFGGAAYGQEFSGLVKIYTGPGASGSNILSTTSLDGWLVGGAATVSANFANIAGGVGFSSDVFKGLTAPLGLSLTLNNVNPVFGIDGNSLKSFNASVAGGASATVPEPASIVASMIGVALLVPTLRRRTRAAA